jgi:hypothetical protein
MIHVFSRGPQHRFIVREHWRIFPDGRRVKVPAHIRGAALPHFRRG